MLYAYPALASEEVDISALNMEYSFQDNLFSARGNVRILFQDLTISADELQLDRNTGDALITGHVVYEDPDAKITAEKIELNFNTKLGTMYESYIFYKERNIHLNSSQTTKTGERSFSLEDSVLTTCSQDTPHWSIASGSVKAEKNKRISSLNNTFRIRDIPVLYTPYFWAPINNDRHTGLLFPSFGYSSNKGSSYKQGFFWAISENLDATFYLDYYNEKGPAGGIDYRYIIDEKTNGELWMYHVRDDEPDRNLFELKAYHNQALPYDTTGFLKIHTVNEFDYYTEMDSTSSRRFGLTSGTNTPFGITSEEKLQKYLESNLHISKLITPGRIYLLAQGRQGLEGSSRTIPQTVPEIAMVINTKALNQYTSYSMNITGTNYYRDEGQKGTRIDLNPAIYFSYGRLFNISQKVGLRETSYFISDPTLTKHRFTADLTTTLSTKLFRSYDSFVHIMEPVIKYDHAPSTDHDNIPFFSSVDSLPQKSLITYALTNRVSGLKHNNLALRFRVSQSYGLLETDKDSPFTPVLVETTLNSGKLDMNFNASYDVHEKTLSETIASLRFKHPKGYIGGGKNYRRASSLDQITFEAGLYNPISISGHDLPIDISSILWYDLNGNGVQEFRIQSTYRSQCWAFSTQFIKQPDDYSILFAVELTGIGTFGTRNVNSFTENP